MRKLLAFLFIISMSTIYSQQLEITQTDKDIISLTFNGDWQKADSIVTFELERNPNNPKYHFLKTYVMFYSRSFNEDGPARDYIIRLTKYLTWKGIKIAETLPPTTESKFYLGYLYSFLCRANIMEQEYWTAYWNASKCQDYLEEVIEEDPSNKDAYFALAVIEYFPDAMVTGFRSFLAWLGGMSGDKEKGIEYFQLVANGGNMFKDEAKLGLGLIHRIDEDYEKSQELMTELYTKYPNNYLAKYFYKSNRLITLITNNGVGFLEDEYNNLKEKYAIETARDLNAVGYAFMSGEKMDVAYTIFNTNLRLFPEAANCYDSFAEWHYRKGDNPNAIKYYQLAYDKLPADTTYNAQYKPIRMQQIQERINELRNQ